MTNQVDGMIRDSDIKFHCRLLLAMVKLLPKELEQNAVDSIGAIVKLENQRLDKIKERNDKTIQ